MTPKSITLIDGDYTELVGEPGTQPKYIIHESTRIQQYIDDENALREYLELVAAVKKLRPGQMITVDRTPGYVTHFASRMGKKFKRKFSAHKVDEKTSEIHRVR